MWSICSSSQRFTCAGGGRGGGHSSWGRRGLAAPHPAVVVPPSQPTTIAHCRQIACGVTTGSASDLTPRRVGCGAIAAARLSSPIAICGVIQRTVQSAPCTLVRGGGRGLRTEPKPPKNLEKRAWKLFLNPPRPSGLHTHAHTHAHAHAHARPPLRRQSSRSSCWPRSRRPSTTTWSRCT